MLFIKEQIKNKIDFVKKNINFSNFDKRDSTEKFKQKCLVLQELKQKYSDDALLSLVIDVINSTTSFSVQVIFHFFTYMVDPRVFSVSFNNLLKRLIDVESHADHLGINILNKILINNIKFTDNKISIPLSDGNNILLIHVNNYSKEQIDDLAKTLLHTDYYTVIASDKQFKNKFLIVDK